MPPVNILFYFWLTFCSVQLQFDELNTNHQVQITVKSYTMTDGCTYFVSNSVSNSSVLIDSKVNSNHTPKYLGIGIADGGKISKVLCRGVEWCRC